MAKSSVAGIYIFVSSSFYPLLAHTSVLALLHQHPNRSHEHGEDSDHDQGREAVHANTRSLGDGEIGHDSLCEVGLGTGKRDGRGVATLLVEGLVGRQGRQEGSSLVDHAGHLVGTEGAGAQEGGAVGRVLADDGQVGYPRVLGARDNGGDQVASLAAGGSTTAGCLSCSKPIHNIHRLGRDLETQKREQEVEQGER